MGDYSGLVAWQRARGLAASIYRLTRRFPPTERFGLSSQMQRAAVSIMANLAEGAGRQNQREFLNYVRIARGSASELESHLMLAQDLGLITAGELKPIADQVIEIRKMLAGLIRHLRNSISQ